MLKSNGKYVIYVNSRHGAEIFEYSVESALSLVLATAKDHPELLAMEAAIDEVMAGMGPALRPRSWLMDALNELVQTQPGELMMDLRTLLYGKASPVGQDSRPEVFCQKEWREEFAVWCFNQNVNPRNLSESYNTLPNENPWEVFSFLAGAKERFPQGVRLVPSEMLEGAKELRLLRLNRWREQAPEINVVSRYVRFLNDWGRGSWDILKIQTCSAMES